MRSLRSGIIRKTFDLRINGCYCTISWQGACMKRVAIYIRVSTSKQDTDNQRRELEAVAARSRWRVVKVYEDAGISGAKGRDQRPGLDAMMKAVNAKEFDMVASWSVDRLGRSACSREVTLNRGRPMSM